MNDFLLVSRHGRHTPLTCPPLLCNTLYFGEIGAIWSKFGFETCCGQISSEFDLDQIKQDIAKNEPKSLWVTVVCGNRSHFFFARVPWVIYGADPIAELIADVTAICAICGSYIGHTWAIRKLYISHVQLMHGPHMAHVWPICGLYNICTNMAMYAHITRIFI